MEVNEGEIVGRTLQQLLQTQSRPVGVWVEEFGEAYWISLVAQLDATILVQINELNATHFLVQEPLIPAQLTQEDFTLADVEGRKVVGVRDRQGDFALVLDNGLCVACHSGPGGNGPWIYHIDSVHEVEDCHSMTPNPYESPPPPESETSRGNTGDFHDLIFWIIGGWMLALGVFWALRTVWERLAGF